MLKIEPKPVYTYGYSTRSIEEFIETLKSFNIEVAVDVRRFPTSKRNPEFSRERLSRKLSETGIEYVWLGDVLGGYRSGGYKRYMRTKNFKEGLKKLVETVDAKTTVIFCCEALWFRCHRRFLAEKLTRLGFKVFHIYDRKRVSLHKAGKSAKRKG
jgi:uncharacterized protein (DUF488 family)